MITMTVCLEVLKLAWYYHELWVPERGLNGGIGKNWAAAHHCNYCSGTTSLCELQSRHYRKLNVIFKDENIKNIILRTVIADQQLKVSDAVRGKFYLIPKTHIVEGKNQLPQVINWPPYRHICIKTQIHRYNECNNNNQLREHNNITEYGHSVPSTHVGVAHNCR